MMEHMHAVAHVAALPFVVGGVGLYASNIWSKRPNNVRLTAVGVGFAVVATSAGAAWMPHVIAGISIGAFASLIWGKWSNRHAQIGLLLGTIFLMAVLGAYWVFWPIGAITLAYLMSTGSLAEPARLLRKWNGTAKGPQPIPAGRYYHVPQQPPTGGAGGAPIDLSKQSAPAPQIPTLTQLAMHPRLPADSRAKVGLIERNCAATLAYLRASGADQTKAEFTTEQIRDDYAPTAVHAYLALPVETANVREIADGKTGAQLLSGQLDLLLRALDELRDQAADASATQLLAHQQFLQNKFGEREGDLQL